MIEPAARPARNRRLTATLVLARISVVLSLIACAASGLVYATSDIDLLPVQSKPQIASASQLEAVAHVVLPPGTVLLSAVYSHGLESRICAKFRMPRAGFDPFVAAAQFTAAPTPGLRAVTAKHNIGGGNLWDPDAAKTVSGIEEQQPAADGTRRLALFDLDAPDVVVVYLFAYRD